MFDRQGAVVNKEASHERSPRRCSSILPWKGGKSFRRCIFQASPRRRSPGGRDDGKRHTGGLVTLDERKSGDLITRKVNDRTARRVRRAITQ